MQNTGTREVVQKRDVAVRRQAQSDQDAVRDRLSQLICGGVQSEDVELKTLPSDAVGRVCSETGEITPLQVL